MTDQVFTPPGTQQVFVLGPVTIRADNGQVFTVVGQIVGEQGNAWNAVAVAAGASSETVDIGGCPVMTVFGHSSGASTLTIKASQDNVNFYDTASTIVIAAAADFSAQYNNVGFRYVAIKSSAAVTLTATIAAKG